jgi:hypothetical protein
LFEQSRGLVAWIAEGVEEALHGGIVIAASHLGTSAKPVPSRVEGMPIVFFHVALHPRAVELTLQPRDLRRLVRWRRQRRQPW